jgi:hypothetical protein
MRVRARTDEGLAWPQRRVHAVADMNRPVQVMLDPSDRRRARRRAAETGLTLAEYIRRLVRQDLESWVPEADEVAVVRIAESEASDQSTGQEHSIGEAVAARLDKTDQPT